MARLIALSQLAAMAAVGGPHLLAQCCTCRLTWNCDDGLGCAGYGRAERYSARRVSSIASKCFKSAETAKVPISVFALA